MTEVRIPAKVVLFGEWAVVRGAPAVVTSLDRYFTLSHSQDSQKFALDILSPEQNIQVSSLTELKDSDFAWFKKVMSYFHFPLTGRLKLQREWKLSEGLGSSSAVFLGIKILSSTVDKNPMELWTEGRKELQFLQEGGSGIDLAAQIFASSLCLKDNKIEKLSLEYPADLRLLHTGSKAHTPSELKRYDLSGDHQGRLARSVEEFLKNQDWEKTIENHAEVLKDFGALPPWVLELKEKWTNRSYIKALKTTGAGGGDALLLIINPKKAADFEREVQSLGFWFNRAAWQGKALEIKREAK